MTTNAAILHEALILQHELQEAHTVSTGQVENLLHRNLRITLAFLKDIQQVRPHLIVKADVEPHAPSVLDDGKKWHVLHAVLRADGQYTLG